MSVKCTCHYRKPEFCAYHKGMKLKSFPKFEITINHSDKHDGMVHLSNFDLDPTGEITVSLDDFKEALAEADYDLLSLEDKITLVNNLNKIP